MADLSQLQHEFSALEREHAGIVEAIHTLRARARQKSIEAAATRSPLPETEIAFWREGIARHQAELMEVQAKIAAVNKELRKAKSDQPIKALSQLPRDVAVQSVPPPRKDPKHNGEIKPGRVLFLEFFLQLSAEGLDPRQFAAFECGAHQLVDEYRRAHKEEAPSKGISSCQPPSRSHWKNCSIARPTPPSSSGAG